MNGLVGEDDAAGVYNISTRKANLIVYIMAALETEAESVATV